MYHDPAEIYATGAFLVPRKLIDETGRPYWGWVVDRFDGDCFIDGDVCDPRAIATTKAGLAGDEDEELAERLNGE